MIMVHVWNFRQQKFKQRKLWGGVSDRTRIYGGLVWQESMPMPYMLSAQLSGTHFDPP